MVTTCRAEGEVRYTITAYRLAQISSVMIEVVRATGLAVSSTSMAQICPAYGLSSRLGQCTSASGIWPPRVGDRLTCMRRSEHHQPCRCCQAGPLSSHSRAASTARVCASRPMDGFPAEYRNPVALMPSRVSQHQVGPGPSRALAA